MPGYDSPTQMGSPLASNASKDEALDYYKRQYEMLEAELADFQQSSRELEAELEKDVEAAELRERQLKERVESLSFEVEEWKTKCKQSKQEANTAQNKLQKEITELRENARNLQLKLRDMEVQNDDFERQARNTTSSLEDTESKYNTALERSVILEGEVKIGEQERESLRIEAQRLREELSDLKVEAEIRQEKLRLAEEAVEEARAALHAAPPMVSNHRPESVFSDQSPFTSEVSAGMTTPPAKSVSSATSEDPTIPSPLQTHKIAPKLNGTNTSSSGVSRPSLGGSSTARQGQYASKPRSGRTSIPGPGNMATPAANRRGTMYRNEGSVGPISSLSHVRGLMHKMQTLQARVQSAKSRLPAPTSTPPRASPRPASSLSNAYIPNTVTMRSSRKRNSGASGLPSAFTQSESSGPSMATPSAGRERPNSRISYAQSSGIGSGVGSGYGRPPSRQSLTSRQSISHLPSATSTSRPLSRQSASGAKTPLGHYNDASRLTRPRSSAAGSYSTLHAHRQSVSQLGNYGMEESPEAAPTLSTDDMTTPTPRRRSGIPAPTKRSSMSQLNGARTNKALGGPGDMGPPAAKKFTGLGETF